MYLLDTQPLMDLLGRNGDRPVFGWLERAEPSENELFASVISFGQIAYAIEEMDPTERNHWRRLLMEGRRAFANAGTIIDVDEAIVSAWQSDLRADHLAGIAGAGEELGEDDRLIIATAIARGYALVTSEAPIFDQIAKRTSLTLAMI